MAHDASNDRMARCAQVAWAGVVVSAAIVLMWITTLNRTWGYRFVEYNAAIALSQGAIVVWPTGPPERNRDIPRYMSHTCEWSDYGLRSPEITRRIAGTQMCVPLWLFLEMSGSVTLGAFLAMRSWRVDIQSPRCGCGYSLVGNVSGRCPECGARIRAALNAQQSGG